MPELLQQLFETYLIPAVVTAVGALFSWIGVQLKKLYQEHIDTKMKEDVVKSTVQYVQQVYKDVSGEEKLQEAVKTASDWLTSKGLEVSEAELRVLTESAVYSMKNGFVTGEVLEVGTSDAEALPEGTETVETKSEEVTTVEESTENK